MTSAKTGAGLDSLRKLLVQAVSARRAASARLSADADGLVERYLPFGGGTKEIPSDDPDGEGETVPSLPPPPGAPRTVPADLVHLLTEAFCRAAGVRAVGESLQRARELRALDYVGWPVSWLTERVIGRDPARKVRRGRLWDELRGVTSGPSGAQQAEIDNALTVVADSVSQPLPAPWSRTTRAAARSRAKQIPGALGAAIGEVLPADDQITGWWRLVGAWQGLLLGCVIVGVAWLGVIVAFGALHVAHTPSRLFADLSLLPWIVLMIAAFLVLGWLTASGAMNRVQIAAAEERERVEAEMRAQMAVAAREMVVLPVEQELQEFDLFRTELRVAAGQT
jgi:hypothetical protein